jgi:hypothetical protein
MAYRTRTYYTDSQKALMWERWRQGWTLHQIAQLFNRAHTSVQKILSRTGGIHDALKAAGVKTWFSEMDLPLGAPMMRTIDRGLANSRIGLVLVTPAFIKGLPNQGVADKELSALLAENRLVPIVHGTTYPELRNVSPLLASRAGLDTAEDSMAVVAEKIAELVKIWV